MDKRTLVIGDIHGGLKALKQVLRKVKLQPKDHLIFLGDYVDGWSESAQVISYLIQLEKKYTCDFLYGNHDEWCHQWLKNGVQEDSWLKHGGRETKVSYKKLSDTEKQEHILFFDRMKTYMIDSKNRLFVHAGYLSIVEKENNIIVRDCLWDRTLWKLALVMQDRLNNNKYTVLPRKLNRFKEMFIGHTPTTNYGVDIPWNRVNVWNIDTGAAFKGKVSVMDINSKKFWQSNDLPSLYPDEKGRN